MAFMMGPPTIGFEPHEDKHVPKLLKRAKILAKREGFTFKVKNNNYEPYTEFIFNRVEDKNFMVEELTKTLLRIERAK